MLKRLTVAIAAAGLFALCVPIAVAATDSTREFRVSSGGTLTLDFKAGGTVYVTGTGGSSVSVSYTVHSKTSPGFEVDFDETRNGIAVITRFANGSRHQSSSAEFRIEVPRYFNIELDSMGGGLDIDGVDGTFNGKTMGGQLILHDVRGKASLTTMGGKIRLTDSELDGSLKTMGGEVLLENVIGDVKASSNGGNVRYKNVQRRNGELGSPTRSVGHDDATGETVQISTMGGKIEVEDAPEGADLKTMGGDIVVRDASRFVRAKTMGGDIRIESVDGWLEATTMGGDIEATVVGSGGDINLVSMSGYITLYVPAGSSLDLELQIAFTKNSRKSYDIDTPFELNRSVTSEWDYSKGSPRKYIRARGSVGGGGQEVKIETINGDIRIVEGRR